MARIHSKKYRLAAKAKAKAEAEAQKKQAELEQVHQKTCPNCQASNTASILYGLPNYDAALTQNLRNGRIVLGGCDLLDGAPTFHCNACQHAWAES